MENNQNIKSPIFITGCGGSGTTLLFRILMEHPSIYPVFEKGSCETNVYLKASILVRQKLFRKWEKRVRQSACSRWMEKTPKHVICIDKILQDFPDAKIIVMVRDCRDVMLSLNRYRRSYTMKKALNRWVNDNKAWQPFANNVHVVQLEQLAIDPKSILKNICKFIGEEYVEELLNHSKNHKDIWDTDKRKYNTPNTRYRNRQVNKPIQQNIVRWVNEMKHKDREMVKRNKEAVKLMNQFGYEIKID